MTGATRRRRVQQAICACCMVLGAVRALPAEPSSPDAAAPPPSEDATSVDVSRSAAVAQAQPSTVSTALVPLGSYAPETSVALGLMFVLFTDVKNPGERPSSLETLGIATARRQFLFELQPDRYWDDQRFHLWNKLEYRYYPDRFFGIGNDVPNRPLSYTRQMLRGRLLFERRLLGSLWLGGYSEAMYMEPVYGAAAPGFADVSGRDGGLAVGVGPQIAWDSRDSALAASQGTLLSLQATSYLRQLGGDYAFWRLVADTREVLGLGSGHVLALRGLLVRNSARVPYYMMAQLGGPDLLRGYYQGRFQDRALSALEFEYRTPFVWRLGAAVFGGVGQVGRDLTDLKLDGWHPSMGAGLRLNVARAEKLNLRVDAGVGSDGPALYVGVGEAF
jgi:hypothetical protein